jgi:hypothetical protein
MRSGLIVFVILVLAARASGANEPIITLSHHNLVPQRIEVHVGEVVRWRTAGGGRVEIRLDSHPGEHHVARRDGEVRGVFLRPGEHRYTGVINRISRRSFAGVVVVHPAQESLTLPPVCGRGSSDMLCIAP